ncbi:MAG: hypothetical protein K0S65_5139, partial [Labilithrix sp.]|nr:hypothetical protein [Labilithrix sp.]
MLIASHRERERRTSIVFVLLTLGFFVTLPSTAINTASYYSGVAFFVALYRTLVWLGDDNGSPWRAAVPLALVSAAICTLRQNYLPVPVLMLATSYGFRVLRSREPWAKRLREPLLTCVLTFIALTPWFVASWQSSRTFLYPLMSGTFNRALDLKATGMNPIREIWHQVWAALEGIGLKTFGFFVLAASLLRERASRRPIWSLAIASAGGSVLLTHSFTQS